MKKKITRRKFVKESISFSMLLALHVSAQNTPLINSKTNILNEEKNRFSELILFTDKLDLQLEFYTKWGLPVIHKNNNSFTLQIGKSKLTFKQSKDGTSPQYHYTINIPTNKLEKAKKWLSKRTELIKDSKTGNDVLYFEKWNAHAIYFKDPAGNIGELIARHTLKNETSGEFTLTDLLYLSEIGLTTDDESEMIEQLANSFGLEKYLNNSAFIGNEYGLFILPSVDYPWLPDRQLKASINPTEIEINDKTLNKFESNLPYNIYSKF